LYYSNFLVEFFRRRYSLDIAGYEEIDWNKKYIPCSFCHPGLSGIILYCRSEAEETGRKILSSASRRERPDRRE
jgi:hypothetical protein